MKCKQQVWGLGRVLKQSLLQVAVDDGGRVAVQVHQAAQDLPSPPLQDLLIHLPVPLAVSAEYHNTTGCRDWSQLGTPKYITGTHSVRLATQCHTSILQHAMGREE